MALPDELASSMSLKDYAAIHLRMPISGNPFLDTAIMQAVRQDVAMVLAASNEIPVQDIVHRADQLIAALRAKR